MSNKFRIEWESNLGISVFERDHQDKVIKVVCMFCSAFGRECPKSMNRKRRRTEKIQYFTPPWRSDKIKEHHHRMHNIHWSTYSSLSTKHKLYYFDMSTTVTARHSLLISDCPAPQYWNWVKPSMENMCSVSKDRIVKYLSLGFPWHRIEQVDGCLDRDTIRRVASSVVANGFQNVLNVMRSSWGFVLMFNLNRIVEQHVVQVQCQVAIQATQVVLHVVALDDGAVLDEILGEDWEKMCLGIRVDGSNATLGVGKSIVQTLTARGWTGNFMVDEGRRIFKKLQDCISKPFEIKFKRMVVYLQAYPEIIDGCLKKEGDVVLGNIDWFLKKQVEIRTVLVDAPGKIQPTVDWWMYAFHVCAICNCIRKAQLAYDVGHDKLYALVHKALNEYIPMHRYNILHHENEWIVHQHQYSVAKVAVKNSIVHLLPDDVVETYRAWQLKHPNEVKNVIEQCGRLLLPIVQFLASDERTDEHEPKWTPQHVVSMKLDALEQAVTAHSNKIQALFIPMDAISIEFKKFQLDQASMEEQWSAYYLAFPNLSQFAATICLQNVTPFEPTEYCTNEELAPIFNLLEIESIYTCQNQTALSKVQKLSGHFQ